MIKVRKWDGLLASSTAPVVTPCRVYLKRIKSKVARVKWRRYGRQMFDQIESSLSYKACAIEFTRVGSEL